MVFLILHNIRSVHNVGSIFRTADAAGVTKVYLTGYTPAPTDRFGRPRKDFTKVSLGAEQSVPWETRKDIFTLLRVLKGKGISIVAVEQDANAVNSTDIKVRGTTALIFGSEVRGIPKAVLKRCDIIAEIPMRGHMVQQAHHPHHTGVGKESLNVSVAAGIILFQLLNSRNRQ